MDVGDWRRSLGLGQHEAAFRDNEIDGEILRTLTAEDLKELGVAVLGHRRKLLTAIAELQGSPAARGGAPLASPGGGGRTPHPEHFTRMRGTRAVDDFDGQE